MALTSIGEIAPDACRGLVALFSDIDDTLTAGGRIPLAVLDALGRLRQSGAFVCLVTGRPVGFVVPLTNYLDVVDMAIAENGGMAAVGEKTEFLFAHLAEPDHAPALARAAGAVRARFPRIVEDPSNFMRRSDWAFRRDGLSAADLAEIETIAEKNGARAIASSIQVHLFRGAVDKASAIEAVMKRRFPDATPEQVLTLGDSSNDETMFDAARFPLSAGVANVRDFADNMTHLPRYIADSRGAGGALELFRTILAHRG